MNYSLMPKAKPCTVKSGYLRETSSIIVLLLSYIVSYMILELETTSFHTNLLNVHQSEQPLLPN